MPTNAYKFTATTVTVPAGQQYATVSVTFYKNLLDPSKSYMLPIKIVSAPGMTVSGNQGIHYYHFIGNDFAGSYDLNFTRWPVSGDTTGTPDNNHVDDGPVTFLPVDPTHLLKMPSGYYTGITYDGYALLKQAQGHPQPIQTLPLYLQLLIYKHFLPTQVRV